MHNRLYPTWHELAERHNPLTEGERTLLKYLDDNLPRDPDWTPAKKLHEYKGWLIFAEPFLNGARPDIVVFRPDVGVMIYEVKDWRADFYVGSEKKLFVKTAGREHQVKTPTSQVAHYRTKLVEQLAPFIGDAIARDPKNFALVKTGVYFHGVDKVELEKTFGFLIPEDKRHLRPLVCREHLVPNHLTTIVPDAYWRKGRWDPAWNEDVLFWLKPPFHSIEQGKELDLKPNQLKVAEPMPGHHRVRGVAGSGKTQALAFRAAKLASQGKDVLVVTFNITLWHYIRDMIVRAPFNFEWERITFNHFHGLCKDVLNEFGLKWPAGLDEHSGKQAKEDFFRATVPAAVAQALAQPGRSWMKYDAILIDEGQDYHYEWYALLNEYFLKERDELVVLCDKRQNIFDRELGWLDKRVTRKGLEKFKDPYIDLTRTYRLRPRAALMTNKFSELFGLDQELKVANHDSQQLEFETEYTEHLVWVNIHEKDWKEAMLDAFQRLKKEGRSPSDMVFLLPDHKRGTELAKLFKEHLNLEVNHVFDEEVEVKTEDGPIQEEGRKPKFNTRKKSFWMGDSRIKMSTIHSFKGWELENVVLFIPEQGPEDLHTLDAVVYTAMTRTRLNLIVINACERYWDFGEELPHTWEDQHP